MSKAKPLVIVTRRLPEGVETRMRELFQTQLNVDDRAMSPPESRVRVACHLARLPHPVPQFEVRRDGQFLGRVDLAFPGEQVAVEYEGAYHFDGVQIVRDDARIARLQAAGWRVVRLSAADLRDLDAVVARVRAALAA